MTDFRSALKEIEEYKPTLRERIWWPIRRFIKDPLVLKRRAKWFLQRGRRGYSNNDVWNMHYYLVEIIIPMLEQLKNGMGHPVFKDVTTQEDWNNKLDVMISGFTAAKRISDYDYDYNLTIRERRKLFSADEKLFKLGMREFTTFFFALWD